MAGCLMETLFLRVIQTHVAKMGVGPAWLLHGLLTIGNSYN
jgi:hypothetical protein